MRGLGYGCMVKADVEELDSSSTGMMTVALMRNRQAERAMRILSIGGILIVGFRSCSLNGLKILVVCP
jgi:hypothetical protein